MNEDKKIKVLIADDHRLLREGLIKMLEKYPDMSIIGEADDGEELINNFMKLKPDIIMTDISMPVLSGIEAVKKVKEIDRSSKILFLSMYSSEEYIYTCLKAGGNGLISKNISEGELVKAVRTVYEGEKYFGSKYTGDKLNKLVQQYDSVYITEFKKKDPPLTKRELEVLKLVGDGCTSVEIANKLFINIRTVDSHRTSIMHKLNLNTRSELIKYAIEYNIYLENQDGQQIIISNSD